MAVTTLVLEEASVVIVILVIILAEVMVIMDLVIMEAILKAVETVWILAITTINFQILYPWREAEALTSMVVAANIFQTMKLRWLW